jgi:hypothetical protein
MDVRTYASLQAFPGSHPLGNLFLDVRNYCSVWKHLSVSFQQFHQLATYTFRQELGTNCYICITIKIFRMVSLKYTASFNWFSSARFCCTPWPFYGLYILYVPPMPQQIQISVDQPYAGPAGSCCVIIGTYSIIRIQLSSGVLSVYKFEFWLMYCLCILYLLLNQRA